MRGLRAKRVRTIKEGTLIVTIDIGMACNTEYCATVDGRDIKPFKFGNTREGFDTFWDMIVINKYRFACSEVVVGYESTGPYVGLLFII
jgi:transposase